MSVPRDTRAGALQQVMATFRTALLAQDVVAQRAILDGLGTVNSRLRTLAQDLQAEIDALGPDVQPWQIERLARYNELMDQIETEVQTFAQTLGSQLPVAQAAAAQVGSAAALAQAQAIAGTARIGARWNQLSAPALREIVASTQVGPLADLLGSFGVDAAAKARAVLIEGIGTGQNARVVGRALEAATGTTRQRAQVIARTEILRAGKSANLQSFAANSDVISGWKWHAFKGPRTCSACLIMDGTEFPTSTTFFPGHPQCRCVAMPILRDYPTPREQTGREYLESLPEDEQRALLGNKKYEAWRNGELELDDMVSPRYSERWGTSYQEASLATAEANAAVRRAGGISGTPTLTPTPAPVTVAPTARQIMHHSGLSYVTPDDALSPEMLQARRIMSTGESLSDDDATFVGKAIRSESMKRAGVDIDAIEQKKLKVAQYESLSTEQMKYALPCYKDKDGASCQEFERIGKELDALRADIVSTTNKQTVDQQSIVSVIKDIDPTFGTSSARINFGYIQSQDRVNDINEASKLFPKKIWDQMAEYTNDNPMNVRIADRGAFDFQQVAIYLNKDVDIELAQHELWHFAEKIVFNMLPEERKFLKRRSSGEQLTDIFPGLGRSEVGYKDKFFNHYSGKVYLNKKGQDWGSAYEVLTTASDTIFHRDGILLLEDPDHAEWFFSMLMRFSV